MSERTQHHHTVQKVVVYVIFGALTLAFLVFVIYTIRCYLVRPKHDNNDEEIDEFNIHYKNANSSDLQHR